MSHIRLLDDRTINQIRAGEVIENPASVVKELLENSVDAKATRIEVITKGAGRVSIVVTDDGEGMDKEDLPLAIARHATSKLTCVEDLKGILSLGFRGEALASIASVAKVAIHSSKGREGYELTIHGGELSALAPKPRQRGTTVSVYDLFYTTPVRRSFHKSSAAETGEIHKTLTKFALSHPDIALLWVHEGKTEIDLLRCRTMQERIAPLLGEDYAQQLLSIGSWGFIGKPSAHRPNRLGQYLTINGRPVTHGWIAQQVLEGYGHRLPPRRFPLFVLHLSLPPSWVDVNVHPQKHEVRLKEWESIAADIKQTISQALDPNYLKNWHTDCVKASECHDRNDVPINVASSRELSHNPHTNFSDSLDLEPTPRPFPLSRSFSPSAPLIFALPPENSPPTEIVAQKKEEPPPFPVHHIMGCMRHYALCIQEDGLHLVDLQRALQRITFEKMEKYAYEACPLLLPRSFEMHREEILFFEEQRMQLEKYGIVVRSFGKNSVLVEALPSWISVEQIEPLLHDLVEEGIDSCCTLWKKVPVKPTYQVAEALAILRQWAQCASPDRTAEGKAIECVVTYEELDAKFRKA